MTTMIPPSTRWISQRSKPLLILPEPARQTSARRGLVRKIHRVKKGTVKTASFFTVPSFL